jgi:hypothetical protein
VDSGFSLGCSHPTPSQDSGSSLGCLHSTPGTRPRPCPCPHSHPRTLEPLCPYAFNVVRLYGCRMRAWIWQRPSRVMAVTPCQRLSTKPSIWMVEWRVGRCATVGLRVGGRCIHALTCGMILTTTRNRIVASIQRVKRRGRWIRVEERVLLHARWWC